MAIQLGQANGDRLASGEMYSFFAEPVIAATKIGLGILFAVTKGFIAQLDLRSYLPLPQTDLSVGFCSWYAKCGEAI